MLYGRESEVATLMGALSDAEDASLLVSGEAGIGKSALLEEALRRVGREWLAVRCHQGVSSPFAHLTDTLDLLPRLEEQLAAAGIRFVGSYRSEELPRGHRLRWVRAELRRSRRLREISQAAPGI